MLRATIAAPILLAAAPQHLARAQVFNAETFTLANGLQVVVIANHRAPIVSHMVWYRVGSADEKPGKSGIAHFLEHLLFRARHVEGSSENLSELYARLGINYNAYMSYDETVYLEVAPRGALPLLMEIAQARLLHPLGGVTEAATQSGHSARQVLEASNELAKNGTILKTQVDEFLRTVRAG